MAVALYHCWNWNSQLLGNAYWFKSQPLKELCMLTRYSRFFLIPLARFILPFFLVPWEIPCFYGHMHEMFFCCFCTNNSIQLHDLFPILPYILVYGLALQLFHLLWSHSCVDNVCEKNRAALCRHSLSKGLGCNVLHTVLDSKYLNYAMLLESVLNLTLPWWSQLCTGINFSKVI